MELSANESRRHSQASVVVLSGSDGKLTAREDAVLGFSMSFFSMSVECPKHC
jgi:hypothetical protein